MEPHQRIYDYDVYGANGEKIGKVDALWADEATDRLEFLGVKTGWLFGKHHVVPARDAQIDETEHAIRVPYTQERVKEAPTVDEDRDIAPDEEQRIYSHYELQGGMMGREDIGRENVGHEPIGAPPLNRDRVRGNEGDLDIPLAEEELHVGKRQVPGETLHLRKVVRTEPVREEIELRREELEIDRVPATGRQVPEDAFREREYQVSSMREEPVVEKEAHLRERVRAHRDVDTEQREVRGQVRKEDVEVDRGEGEFRDRE